MMNEIHSPGARHALYVGRRTGYVYLRADSGSSFIGVVDKNEDGRRWIAWVRDENSVSELRPLQWRSGRLREYKRRRDALDDLLISARLVDLRT